MNTLFEYLHFCTVPSSTRRSARIAGKRRSTLTEVRADEDPWLSTIDPDFFVATENVEVHTAKKQRSSQTEFEMSVDEMEQMIWTLVWSQDQIYPEYINSFDKDYIKKLHNEYSVSRGSFQSLEMLFCLQIFQ